MKQLFFLLTGALFLFASCEKVGRELPGVKNPRETDSLRALRAWVEQVAVQKRDSMQKVDSIVRTTGNVDTNSLFYKKNMMVAVVEVNDHYFKNVLCFKDQDGKYMFDLAFPFSANLNIDPSTGKAFVKYNPEHQAMLRNGTFRAVMNAGMPVGLSLLGNHDAAGWSNFKNIQEATDFAQLVAIEVRQKGFSAVLSDDEWSSSVSGAAPNSYVMAMHEIKRLLPDIFLCYYIYGGGSGTYNGKQMGDIADAAFTAFYPQYPFNPYNFPNRKTFGSASETHGGFGVNALTTATQIRTEGRGGMMFYNVWKSSTFYAPYLQGLKGKTQVVTPGCINPDSYGFINGN